MKRSSNGFKNIPEFFNMIDMIYYLMVGIPLAVFLFLYLEMKSSLIFYNEEHSSAKIIFIAFILSEMFIGEFIFKKLLYKDINHLFFREKLQHYFKMSILRFSFYMSATIFAVAALYLQRQGIFAGLYVIILFAFSLIRPTKTRLIRSRIFTKEEAETIRTDGSVD